MKILIDITHPAHVHFFRFAIQQWQTTGHSVVITSRDKDLTLRLLDHCGFDHTLVSQARKGIMGLSLELLERCSRLWSIVRSEAPQVLTAIGGTFVAPLGKLTDTPIVVFTDTEHARLSNSLTFPLATVICTPTCYEDPIRHNQIKYAGYQELAYLHPRRFKPEPSQLQQFGVSANEPYIVMRLVAWSSGHDLSDSGFTNLEAAVQTLSDHGRVLISSEKPLPPALSQRSIQAAPEHIHHLLAFASLYIGESATMASESAILGTPAILVSTSTRGYTNEQGSKYDMVYTFSDPTRGQEQALNKASEILDDPEAREKWRTKRGRMLADKIDVTQFIVDTVEKYGHDHQCRVGRGS